MPLSSKIQVAEKKRSGAPDDRLDAKDRRLVAWGLGAAGVLALALLALMLWLKNYAFLPPDPDANTLIIQPDYARHLVDFTLKDQTGRAVTQDDIKDKILVVDFLVTSCTVTCPYVNAQMKKVQDATAGMSDVRLLSLTLDPFDDTVPRLALYAPGCGADPARWSFLTGDPGVVHNLVATSFLPPDTANQFSYMPGSFAHVQRIALVGRDGHVVCYFDGLNQNAAPAIVDRIKQMESSR